MIIDASNDRETEVGEELRRILLESWHKLDWKS
jgi:hypothetical protein